MARSTHTGAYEGVSVPDAITPVVAIRAWRVSQSVRDELRLFSTYKNGIVWPIGEKLEARCIDPASVWATMGAWTVALPRANDPIKKLPKHDAPYDDCTCGIYALNSWLIPGEAKPWQEDSVKGIVLMWGHILEGQRGYRAQYAKVVALHLDSDDPMRAAMISQMAELYEVPTVLDLPKELDRQKKLQGVA